MITLCLFAAAPAGATQRATSIPPYPTPSTPPETTSLGRFLSMTPQIIPFGGSVTLSASIDAQSCQNQTPCVTSVTFTLGGPGCPAPLPQAGQPPITSCTFHHLTGAGGWFGGGVAYNSHAGSAGANGLFGYVLLKDQHAIYGHVLDVNGKPRRGVRVDITGKGGAVFAVTDQSGLYDALLPKGRYTVSAGHGFKPRTSKVVLHATAVADFHGRGNPTLQVFEATTDTLERVRVGDELLVRGSSWDPTGPPIEILIGGRRVGTIPAAKGFDHQVKVPGWGNGACHEPIEVRQGAEQRSVELQGIRQWRVLFVAGHPRIPNRELVDNQFICEGELGQGTFPSQQSGVTVAAGLSKDVHPGQAVVLDTRGTNSTGPANQQGSIVVDHPLGGKLIDVAGVLSAKHVLIEDPSGHGALRIPAPRLNAVDYDPERAGVPDIQDFRVIKEDPDIQGFSKALRGAPIKVHRRGHLTFAVAYIEGTVTWTSGIEGRGSVIATTNLVVHGGADFAAGGRLALIAGNILLLTG